MTPFLPSSYYPIITCPQAKFVCLPNSKCVCLPNSFLIVLMIDSNPIIREGLQDILAGDEGIEMTWNIPLRNKALLHIKRTNDQGWSIDVVLTAISRKYLRGPHFHQSRSNSGFLNDRDILILPEEGQISSWESFKLELKALFRLISGGLIPLKIPHCPRQFRL